MGEEKKFYRKIEAAGQMKQLMTDYYVRSKVAESTDEKVCWITSGGPVEFLIAMDVIPIYPENHGAMCGAARMSVPLAEVAEEMGFSRDLCSYARLDIGSAVTKGGPIGGLPKPDFLLCCNNICGTVVKWYQHLSRYFGVPMFLLDTPFIHASMPAHSSRYVESQFEELVKFLEEQTGKEFSMDRFEEVAILSVEGVELWKSVLKTAENKPSPLTSFDAFVHMAPIVTLRGTKEVVEYYQLLLGEMKTRIESGVSAVPREKYRFLWDNIPVWYAMRELGEVFAKNDSCLVADTYTSAWAVDIKLDEPFASMASAYTNVYLNISIDLMLEKILSLMNRYSVDGVVMHSNRSCKPYSLGQYDLAREITKKTGKPVLILEADMTDSRVYSSAQAKERIEAFVESLS